MMKRIGKAVQYKTGDFSVHLDAAIATRTAAARGGLLRDLYVELPDPKKEPDEPDPAPSVPDGQDSDDTKLGVSGPAD